VVGFKDVMRVTPSHLLTREQAAHVRSVTTKSGALKFEGYDKLAALVQLAKILGITPEPKPQTVNNVTVNVNQVNFGDASNAFETARRLAFAIEKARRAGPLLEAAATDASDEAGNG
jgi:hypothetical protein